MSNYIGKVCPYCRTEFVEDDDVVMCSECEMPHHKDCWISNKGCTTFGCTGTIQGIDFAPDFGISSAPKYEQRNDGVGVNYMYDPNTYGQSVNYAQNTGYVQNANYMQNAGYVQNTGYNQYQGYMQNTGYNQNVNYTQNVGYAQNVGNNQYQGYPQNIDYAQNTGYMQNQNYNQNYNQNTGYAQNAAYTQSYNFCVRCGNAITVGARFCHVCGTPVGGM